MKILKSYLPDEHKEIEVHIFADEHIGDSLCDVKHLKERIDYVANKDNAYCILNGDLMDNATKSSIGDTYSQMFNPMEQLEACMEMFKPLADTGKILAITPGNHENRTYKKEGVDLTKLMAMQLGVADKYSPTSAFIFVRFGQTIKGRKQLYTIYCLHGSGGGRKDGGKINRLVDMQAICDADIYIHSHTHLPALVKKSFFRPDYQNSYVKPFVKLFVNTASNLSYGGYGETAEYSPSCNDYPVIFLDGTKRWIEGRL